MYPFDGRKGKKLAYDIVGDIRFFAYYIGNETILANTAPWGIKYNIEVIFEPSEALGNIFALKLYNEYDALSQDILTGVNTGKRIGQYIQSLTEPDYSPDPPFTATELQPTFQGNWRDVIVRFTRDFGLRKLLTEPLQDLEEDYAEGIIDYGSGLEMLLALFCNVLRMDHGYYVINEAWARHRASQYIRAYCDEQYTIKPALKSWETTLWC